MNIVVFQPRSCRKK